MKTPADKQAIHFIIMGGTIDSYYDGVSDTVVPRKKSIIPEFIRAFKLQAPTKFTTVCMKDSRALASADRKQLLEALESTPAKRIIITHGTYTMPVTARYLKKHLKRADQVIILTGSMIPLGGVSPSDGGFNLGYSVAQTQLLPSGIYVCMNGRVFEPQDVIKIIYRGVFGTSEELQSMQ